MPDIDIGTPDAADIQAAYISAEKEVKIGEEEVAVQVNETVDLQTTLEDITNPLPGALKAQTEDIKKKSISVPAKLERKQEAQRIIISPDAEDRAYQFEQRNPELKQKSLLSILKELATCKNKEDLLALVKRFYPDPTLANDALSYLKEVVQGEFKVIVESAIEDFNAQFSREIVAGQNIAEEVKEYSKMGLGEPSTLRQLYRNITTEQRETIQLCKELYAAYSPQNLKTVISFLHHAIGSDLKQGGFTESDMTRLSTLLKQVKSLQGFKGLDNFMKDRFEQLVFLSKKNGYDLPPQLSGKALAGEFLSLLEEHYPTAEKVLQIPKRMGL